MKILQINKFYYLRGGSERYMFELSRALVANGHDVIPFSMKDPKNLNTPYSEYFIDPVDLERFNLRGFSKYFYNWQAVKNLQSLIDKEKPDLAHLHNIAHQLSPAIIKVLKKNNIPVIQTLHDYKLICPNYQLFSKGKNCNKCFGGKYYNCLLEGCVKNSRPKSFMAMLEAYLNNRWLKLYESVDLFIAPSEYMKGVCVKAGVPEQKIKVIYNFINPDDFEPNAHVLKNYLLYFGRLTKEKGIETLLEAFKENENGHRLKIVGSGPEAESLTKKIEEMDLSDKVELLGQKNGLELSKLINEARAVILPSLWPENMPYSMLEAMAAGKVVIASMVGGLPEMIEDGKNGLLFKAEDPQELARKIDELEKSDLVSMGHQAKQKVFKINAKEHYEIINTIYNQQLLNK